ncbi:MAG TPA: membrane dipeptidase [Terriglobales bacterium]|jgi:membrane dipeptidase|nr:membrane dipeptidase [Terriglobales bacterium]
MLTAEPDVDGSNPHGARRIPAGSLGRREFLRAIVSSLTLAPLEPILRAILGDPVLLAEAAALSQKTVTVDLHGHASSISSPYFPGVDPNLVENIKAGGLDAAVLAIRGDYPLIKRETNGHRYEARSAKPGELLRRGTEQLDKMLDGISKGKFSLGRSPSDIIEAKKRGVPCILPSLEGCDPLEGDLARIKEFYERGVCVLQLMHYRINEIGDIQTAPPRHHGLSDFGREVVREMNRLGMVIDTAHSSPDTLSGVLKTSRTPVIFSHTGIRALRALSRHLDDTELRAIAAKGGIIGIWPNLRRRNNFDTFLKDIDYAQKLVGADHVGIGTDVFGLGNHTAIPTHKEFALIPAALLKRGYSDSVVEKIVGENFMRLFREVVQS